ncbi:hypothetical protein AVEN_93717-1 [Araneus ventricosus]|uniref:Uncharacterized protein n=1 Tax=Araneus ventricosus TaxID=182803 RepID=A0A4Y2WZP3_ARAVE|nr:hypothetical protein AVEN_93717-1 [Araneus ventricosus]
MKRKVSVNRKNIIQIFLRYSELREMSRERETAWKRSILVQRVINLEGKLFSIAPPPRDKVPHTPELSMPTLISTYSPCYLTLSPRWNSSSERSFDKPKQLTPNRQMYGNFWLTWGQYQPNFTVF